ncbi:MAG TPA: endolytic transglycosylase MltG [Solirubrobacteraceae bacterium]|nr:endolytic transglycosylase MltG [Solirubrobacteraceae bacterium]
MSGSDSQPQGNRTSAEREAARKERERRRAQRRGVQPEQTAGAAQEQVETEAGTPERTDISGGASEAAQVAAPAVHAEAQAVEETHGEPAGEPTQAWDLADDLTAAEHPAHKVASSAVASVEPEHPQPASSRPAWRPRGAADALPAPPPPVSQRGARVLRPRLGRASASGGGAHSLRARAGAVGALVIVAIAVWGVVMLIQHFGGSKASNGPPIAAAPEVKVVIPEGESRLQIAAIAHKDGLTGNYMRASTRSQALQPERFGAPASIPNLEGFLFPATYKMPVHGNVKGLVERQLEAFQERFGSEEQKHARALGLTSYQLLIVASMIEREAYLASDRPLVAAVIYNRLRQGIPLGIDSTIRFALNDYTRPLTEAQLQTPSPYNTRLHKGLPPTPISNPGMEAIEAAAHPAHVGYLYYVDGADGCGDLVFSDTEAEFEANKAAYNQALAANGGHTPACKHK